MPMSPDQVKRIIRERGWTSVDLAARWEISVTWMSRLVNQPHSRPAMYEDAFNGLPSRERVTVEREPRHIRKRRIRQTWTVQEMFPTWRLFEATNSQVVDEGTQWFVHEVRGVGHAATICFRRADQPDDPNAAIEIDVSTAQCHFADMCRDLEPGE